MKRSTLVAFVVMAATLMPLSSFAVSVKFCTTWKSRFVDAGHGEDTYYSTSWLYRTAKYAHYQVRNRDNNNLIKSGILDSSGCTTNININSGTRIKFRQATKLERGSGRRIYVQYQDAPSFGANYTWLNSYLTIGSSSGTINLKPNWEGAGASISVVASRVLTWYSTLEYPAYTTTYILPADRHNTSYNSGSNIAIDTEWNHLPGTPNYGMDMSKYKFIIGHELGHRQANATGGPLTGSYDYTNTSVAKCNCKHFPPDYSLMCMQSQEHIGAAAKEAWAFFYAAALFNSRETNCGMSYWRAMYTGSTPGSSSLDITPPVSVNCAASPLWQDNLCPGTDKGVLQDWLAFFWDTWTNGGSYKFSVNELTNVWNATSADSTSGELWDDLVDTVENQHGSGSWKWFYFVINGSANGVDS